MNRSVVFLMSGPAHLPYLCVALHSLRQHYSGKIVVYAYPESIDVVELISKDSELNITPVLFWPAYRGKNDQFHNKQFLMQSLDPGANLYLDADIMAVLSIDPLFELIEEYGFVATQFCNWVSTGGVVRNRVQKLLDRPGIDQESVRKVLSIPYPSVNGGVFGCRPDSPVLKTWLDWTSKTLDLFINDECCLHPIVALYENSPLFHVAKGGHWNCSPKYKSRTIDDREVAIWHFHGDSNVRPNKSKEGFKLWWPVYQKCLEMNVGRIQQWKDEVVPTNRFLKGLTKEPFVFPSIDE